MNPRQTTYKILTLVRCCASATCILLSLQAGELFAQLPPMLPDPANDGLIVDGEVDSLQQQMEHLQQTVADLQRRLDDAEATAALSYSACYPAEASAPCTQSPVCLDPQNYHRHGAAGGGSLLSYYRTFDWSKDAYISVGSGLRTSYNAAENMAANGTSYSSDFAVDNMRLYFNGRGHKYIGYEVNTDIQNTRLRPLVYNSNGTSFRLLDAIVKFGNGGAINAWMGRMLPPTSRQSLSGPFFVNNYDFPFVTNQPAVFDGRQDGAVLWGLVANQSIKYQVGIYDGANSVVGGANPNDNPEFNARLVWNLLDPETGYYNQSTYFGTKDVLAVGATVVHQNSGVFSATNGVSNYNSWAIDALYDKKLGNGGVLTLAGTYYDYDTGVLTDDSNANTRDGRAGLAVIGYMFATDVELGGLVGRFRPVFRWQEYNRTFQQAAANAAAITRGIDAEMQYIIYGHNARLSAGWGQRSLADGRNHLNVALFGAQLQF